MSRFEIQQTPLEGLVVLQRKLLGDSRGYLERVFCQKDLVSIVENCQLLKGLRL